MPTVGCKFAKVLEEKIITSLRKVKNFFKNGTHGEVVTDDIYGTREENPLRVITKKPITATAVELKLNKRSRSAKMRVAEKK